jgi:hypothetical protein
VTYTPVTDASKIYAAAVAAGAKWPGLVRAQWKLESGGGLALSAKHNYFGLKSAGGGNLAETNEYINGKKVTIADGFINFESMEECVTYLVDRWYKDYKQYRGINNEKTLESAARRLQSEGYATDPEYAKLLIRIAAEYERQGADLTDTTKDVNLVDVPPNFRGLAHQVKALKELQASLTDKQREAFTKAWRATPATPQAPAGVAKPSSISFPLDVPYFYQRDSKTGNGERMCQSSAIAMRIEQIDPKLIGDDDSYLNIVLRYGDTVSQAAHQKALDSIGLKHRFRQDGTERLLCELLDKGMAVPIGILHKGPVDHSTGGGHWITLIGYDQKNFHVHDPFGELNLISGGYDRTGPTDGRNQRYTRKNLMKRWLINSQSDGWLWEITK